MRSVQEDLKSLGPYFEHLHQRRSCPIWSWRGLGKDEMGSEIKASLLQRKLEDLKSLHQIRLNSVPLLRVGLCAGRENPFTRDSGCLYRQVIHGDAKDSWKSMLVCLSTIYENKYYSEFIEILPSKILKCRRSTRQIMHQQRIWSTRLLRFVE